MKTLYWLSAAALCTIVCSPVQARLVPTSSFEFDRHAAGNQYTVNVVETRRGKRVRHATHYKRNKNVNLRGPRTVALPQRHATVHVDAALIAYGGDLVSRARSYIGTNPTGWASVWCGRFMAMIAPEAARRIPNPNMARDWARLPRVEPRIGAIAIFTRGKCSRTRCPGHVGVIAGFTRDGHLIVISGNHNRRVGEGVYSRSRLIAAVAA